MRDKQAHSRAQNIFFSDSIPFHYIKLSNPNSIEILINITNADVYESVNITIFHPEFLIWDE